MELAILLIVGAWGFYAAVITAFIIFLAKEAKRKKNADIQAERISNVYAMLEYYFLQETTTRKEILKLLKEINDGKE